jgi:hypothetical protein
MINVERLIDVKYINVSDLWDAAIVKNSILIAMSAPGVGRQSLSHSLSIYLYFPCATIFQLVVCSHRVCECMCDMGKTTDMFIIASKLQLLYIILPPTDCRLLFDRSINLQKYC